MITRRSFFTVLAGGLSILLFGQRKSTGFSVYLRGSADDEIRNRLQRAWRNQWPEGRGSVEYDLMSPLLLDCVNPRQPWIPQTRD